MDESSKKIFWIASYPKSGNTWVRALISSLFFSKNGIFNFELLKNILDFDIRERYEFVKSINHNDFKQLSKLNFISKYRIKAQELANVGGNFAFYKTHSANISSNGNNFTNSKNTKGLIYLVRDPRDVAISYSKHLEKTIDETIYIMSQKNALTYTRSQYPVLMSRWDYNYLSWKNLEVPKLIIKYENINQDTKMVLNKIINFFKSTINVKFECNENMFKNILESTHFSKLQQNEKVFGFKEAAKSVFFRKGEINQWKTELNKQQINKIEKLFKNNMIELGYL